MLCTVRLGSLALLIEGWTVEAFGHFLEEHKWVHVLQLVSAIHKGADDETCLLALRILVVVAVLTVHERVVTRF